MEEYYKTITHPDGSRLAFFSFEGTEPGIIFFSGYKYLTLSNLVSTDVIGDVSSDENVSTSFYEDNYGNKIGLVYKIGCGESHTPNTCNNKLRGDLAVATTTPCGFSTGNELAAKEYQNLSGAGWDTHGQDLSECRGVSGTGGYRVPACSCPEGACIKDYRSQREHLYGYACYLPHISLSPSIS